MGQVSRAHSKKPNNRKTKLGGKIKEREKVNGRWREVYDQIFGRLKGVSVAIIIKEEIGGSKRIGSCTRASLMI